MIIKLSWFRSLECSSSNIIKAQSVFACMHTFIKNTLSHLYIHQANKCIQISSSSIDINISLSLNKNDKVNPVLYMYILFLSESGKRPWTAIFVYITKFHAYLDFVCRCHTKIVNLNFLFTLQIVYYHLDNFEWNLRCILEDVKNQCLIHLLSYYMTDFLIFISYSDPPF